MSQYTKGEWKIARGILCKKAIFIRSGDTDIAEIFYQIPNAEANAQLISVAPMMYETLKSLSLGDIDPVYRQIIVKVLAQAEGKDE